MVTTPFSLARLLPVHCFLFLRLCHLVLDEADQLFSRAPDQVTQLLLAFTDLKIYMFSCIYVTLFFVFLICIKLDATFKVTIEYK